MPDWVASLPAVNATLNGTAAGLLVLGFFLIRRGEISTHTVVMLLAVTCSILFLISYCLYHFYHGASRFPGHGWIRPVYFSILISHTVLAVIVVPMVLRTLYLAAKDRYAEHRSLARWTFPVWLYVSVTGVMVYWMLYRINWI